MVLTAIDRVSASLGWRLSQCAHEVGLGRARKAPPRAGASNSTAVALGNTAHRVLERALTVEPLSIELNLAWYATEWSAALEAERLNCVDPSMPERWRRYSLVKRGVRRVAEHLRRDAEAQQARLIVEREIYSETKPLWGKPDVVLVFEDGTAEIVDFKTGEHEDVEPDARELQQLDLYSMLVSDVYGLEVVTLRICRAHGPDWRGPASHSRSAEAWRIIDIGRVEYNAHLGDTLPLASPGDGCQRCKSASHCSVVWDALPAGFVGVRGSLAAVHSDAGAMTLEIATSYGAVTVVGCPMFAVQPGQSIRIAHLRRLDDVTYRWVFHVSSLASE